ncbi:aminomethyl transferase [Plasmodium gonderi]|uniref:Aminomethyl transferase n=1 Tax=Plasmodium gonderi TaxID=77519 RepID=A0A1Y1JL02_PLAGO|nr:aminomethyl transferase [Plasmodium gonderi]GAW82135.1 aminomethyl transferase [Plasmodium gonderi]
MTKTFSLFMNRIICREKTVLSLPHTFVKTHERMPIFNCINRGRTFGTYGAVTRKRQKQREKFYEEKYKHNPNNIPKFSKVKKGSRGGWINNPLKEVTKNNGKNFVYEQKVEEEISSEERECINSLIEIRKQIANREIYSCNMGKKDEREQQEQQQGRNYQDISKNINLFSICENFIDKKKEIINKIENPQYFVDTHIKKLVNEYSNINHLHDNTNVTTYPKVPAYLKDLHKKKRNTSRVNTLDKCKIVREELGTDANILYTKGENQMDDSQQKGGRMKEQQMIDESDSVITQTRKRNMDDKILQKILLDGKSCISREDIGTHGDDNGNDKGQEEIKNENVKVNKKLDIVPPSNYLHGINDTADLGKVENDTEDQILKKMYIEDILNYVDEGEELDISCLDTFTTLNTADRNRKLGSLFSSHGASFILYNNCIIPSKFSTGTMSEYFHTRNGCSLFDKSYQLIIKLTGKDCVYICNHFISSDIYDMSNYDICYTCILDNKSYILDTAYVLKLENEIILVSSGFYKKGVYEFLSDYILFCKDSGMDVHIQVETNKRVLSLQGPLSSLVFNDILDYYNITNMEKDDNNRAIRYLKNVIKMDREYEVRGSLYFKREEQESKEFFKIPYMSFKKLNMENKVNNIKTVTSRNSQDELNQYEILCIHCGDTGEDGYEFIVDNNISDNYVELFLSHVKVKLAGAYALNMLRMESGFPIYGIDIFKNTTPISASLAWTLKYKKIKEKTIFGYQNLLKEYSIKPKFLRIGIICNELIFKTCKILSYPYKQPIGYVTSCTWSPVYKKRIAQGYIKREFAKNNEKVLISIPTDIPQEFSKKKKYKIMRSRSAHKFTLAQVCAFPFVEHKY